MRILLSRFIWYNSNDIRVTGFIRAGNKYVTGQELVKYFSGINSIIDFRNLLRNSNGQFSVVIRYQDEIWAATDRLRNYPLFYTFRENQFVISDDCYSLAFSGDERKIDPIAAECFLQTGCTINNLTLMKDIFQVEAGKYIRIANSVTGNFYDEKCTEAISDIKPDQAAKELNNLIHDVFKNHLEAIDNKFIAVPLSGGFDSRLIAAMCKKYHPENVICYTYGTRNNPEQIIAEKVSNRLGLKWINIVYDSDLIKGYLQDELFRNYFPYVSNLTSMFFMQEYFAVKYLKENNLIPGNCIFIPGFSGDMIAGSHLKPSMKKQLHKHLVARQIYENYFVFIKRKRKERSGIIELIGKELPSGNCETWKVIESWDMKERQAKFIINSAKVYSYFGFDYILPFWDLKFIDFFSSLPFEMKLNKKLYDQVLKNGIFKELNLNLSNEINPLPSELTFQRFKEKIKSFLPAEVRNRFIQKKSTILYDEITRVMIDDIDSKEIIQPVQANYYNSYIIQWYLKKTRDLLNTTE